MKPTKLDEETRVHLRVLNQTEPITRSVEKGDHEEGMSPYDPPEAYEPPGAGQSVPYDEMHPMLQALRDDHQACIAEMDRFDKALDENERNEDSVALGRAFKSFFEFVETEVLAHNRREETVLFPLLATRLIEDGECSTARAPITAVDALEEDHIRLLQASTLALNFLALAEHLADEKSRAYVVNTAIRTAKGFVKLLRLHIFREDNIVLSLAHKLISAEEFDDMLARMRP